MSLFLVSVEVWLGLVGFEAILGGVSLGIRFLAETVNRLFVGFVDAEVRGDVLI